MRPRYQESTYPPMGIPDLSLVFPGSRNHGYMYACEYRRLTEVVGLLASAHSYAWSINMHIPDLVDHTAPKSPVLVPGKRSSVPGMA
eukprot:1262486-Rhodomonas_salina.1